AAILLGTARAERALVHLAAHAEGTCLRELRRAEGTCIEAVAAADAHVLVVQHDAFAGLIEAIDRTDRHAGRVGTVHTGDRGRFLARYAVASRLHARAVNSPRLFVGVLTDCDAAVGLDAALGVEEAFHSSHI